MRQTLQKNPRFPSITDIPMPDIRGQSTFRFRTLSEARNLARLLSHYFPEPETAIYGLNELLINAIEHGNLGITYEEKTKLLLSDAWEAEVERRQLLPENKDKYAYLSFELTHNSITLRIADQGAGFEWDKYLEISPDRVSEPNGRGIAMSRLIAFKDMAFNGRGNEVVCNIPLVNKG